MLKSNLNPSIPPNALLNIYVDFVNERLTDTEMNDANVQLRLFKEYWKAAFFVHLQFQRIAFEAGNENPNAN